MAGKYQQIHWQESKNGVTIDCSVDIAIHRANSEVILLTVPGVDGSVDGYKDKYALIAEDILQKHNAAVVRMSNPFITSFHWESNLRQVLKFISENKEDITSAENPEIRIMAHSTGASVAAQISWEFAYVSHLLLINPATKLGLDQMKHGLSKFKGEAVFLFGGKDPSVDDLEELLSLSDPEKVKSIILNGVDHNFEGEYLKWFIDAPSMYLFN